MAYFVPLYAAISASSFFTSSPEDEFLRIHHSHDLRQHLVADLLMLRLKVQ